MSRPRSIRAGADRRRRRQDVRGHTGKGTSERLALVQISTWNDWGEGTMIEPSTEFGYRDLEVVQRLRRQIIEPGFANKPDDLRLPHRLYKLRKAAKDQPALSQELDRVSRLLSKGSIKAARESLDLMEKRRRPDAMKRTRRTTAITKLDHCEPIPEALLMNTEPVANESSEEPLRSRVAAGSVGLAGRPHAQLPRALAQAGRVASGDHLPGRQAGDGPRRRGPPQHSLPRLPGADGPGAPA